MPRTTFKKNQAAVASEHEEFVHPNLEISNEEVSAMNISNSQIAPKPGLFKRMKKFLKSMDKLYLKRWFRYKYNPNERRIEVAELFQNDAHRWDEILQNEAANLD